jgi:cyanate permease
MDSEPKKSAIPWHVRTLGWKSSLVWIAFVSTSYALDIFRSIHPWQKALSMWFIVPFTLLLAYHFGRGDVKREQLRREIEEMEEQVTLAKLRMTYHFKDREN